MPFTPNGFRDLVEEIKEKYPRVFKAFESISINFNKSSEHINDLLKRVELLEKPMSRCSLFNSTGQVIPPGVLTAITFDTLIEDNDSMFNTAFNTRITFRTPGWYSVGANVQWQFVAGGNRRTSIRLNGTTMIIPSDRRTAAVVPGDIININATRLFNQNDYIELLVSQNTAGNLDILTAADYSPALWATMVQKQYNMNAIPDRRQ